MISYKKKIGGSTEEAQTAIGREVSERIIKFINTGSTIGAVNFPNIDLPYAGPKTHRILNIHKNIPGVLKVLFLYYYYYKDYKYYLEYQ